MGHFCYAIYSYFYIELFPCANSTENNNHCKLIELIDFYLKNSFIQFEMEDIELTPNNFNTPTMERNRNIFYKIGKYLFQEVDIFEVIIKKSKF